ncbi:MAG: DUF3617 family protein [Bradyrhizobiaceae bacterium]|nr:MAG: DUF3617 family protein [Bradyrhizobiaceae bacterium]
MTRPLPSGRVMSILSGAVVCTSLQALPARAEFDMPTRKAGLWEITMVMAGTQIPPRTVQHCTDPSIDKEMGATFDPMAKQMCPQRNVQKTATGMVIDSTCNIGGISSTSHTQIDGDFNSAYTVQVTSTHPGLTGGPPKETNMTMQAKWMGPCKPDQKPGDMIMPGGIKMNIKDMQALRNMIPGGMPHGGMAPGNMAPGGMMPGGLAPKQ